MIEENTPMYRPLCCHYLDENTIKNEIESFNFTVDISLGFLNILKGIIFSKNNSLYWVSGLIGSGKTYYLKYIYYLLNKNTSVKSLIRFNSFVLVNLEDEVIKNLEGIISKSEYDVIMFNLLHSNDFENIGCAFFNQFNKHRGFNCDDIQLAILLEKQLDQKGKFKEFKRQIESEFDFKWEMNAVALSHFQLKSVLQIAKSICPVLDIYLIENQLRNRETSYFNLLKLFEIEIKEYLTDKNENYRLIFIVDNLYPDDLNTDVKMFQIKDLLDKLTSIDSRISVIISSPAVDESNPINSNMVKLRDKLFRHIIYLSRLNKI